MLNKTILITGAAKGIGAAIAKEFAKTKKYNICINYNTSFNEAIKLQNEILNTYDVNAKIYHANISNRDEVDNMIDNILKDFSSIDVIVNNAGICEYKLFTDLSCDDVKNMIDVSIIGNFNVTQSALKKYMINRKDGSIINISSMWGIVGASLEVNYSTSKSAIIGMTKALAKELALSNIRVNAVAPGVISTDMMKDFSQEELERIKEEIPLNRIGTPEEVASVVRFLASDDASYITGQIISPNGGYVV
jgi:3-oxoacyl-[acyl-carrier protein] reductase